METEDIEVIKFDDHPYFDLMKHLEAEMIKAFAIPAHLIEEMTWKR